MVSPTGGCHRGSAGPSAKGWSVDDASDAWMEDGSVVPGATEYGLRLSSAGQPLSVPICAHGETDGWSVASSARLGMDMHLED
jgi:hypothetical protein